MDSKQNINSTEKLLNIIRGKSEVSFGTIGKSVEVESRKKTIKSHVSLPSIFSNKKRYMIGIDIGNEFIHLAKTIKASDGKHILVDQKIIKYNQQTPQGSAEFSNLLKAALISFSGSFVECDFWTMISAGEVNVHNIKIPRVPKKQLENVIYWTAKKENPFEEKNFIFDYEMQGEITHQGIPKYSVMVYTAPKAEIEKIKTFFSNIGINLFGITIPPFAIQNIFRTKWIKVTDANFASLFIGNDFSRIDIYSKNNLVFTRGIKTGINSMLEAIDESIGEKAGKTKLTREEIRTILSSLGSDDEKIRQETYNSGLSKDDIFDMIAPALERLTRQIERTLEYYASSVGFEKVEKLYIASVINVYDQLLSFISDQLGTKTELFDPIGQQFNAQATQSLALAERVSLVPVLGLSLSDIVYTPNFIFTYKEKNTDIARRQINRAIFSSFAVALIICIITLFYQGWEASALSNEKLKLEKELALYNPILSTEKISKIADDVKAQRQYVRQYSQRYLGVAAIGELAALTPDNIKLISVKINTGASPSENKTEKTDKAEKETKEDIILEGVIFGDRNMLDSFLAQYVMKLENSPMLRSVTLQKSNIVNFKKSEILHFSLSLKIG